MGLLLLFLAFRNTDLAGLMESIRGGRYQWLAISVVASVAAFLSRACRWIIIIQSLGYNVSLKSSYHALMTGMLANLALPRAGEVTRCVVLGRKERIPVDRLIGSVVMERGVDLVGLLVIIGATLIVRGDLVGPFLTDHLVNPLAQRVEGVAAHTTIIIMTAVVTVFGIIAAVLLRHRLRKSRFLQKIAGFTLGVIKAFGRSLMLKKRVEFLFHTIFIWICWAIMTWAVFYVLPATSHLGLGDGLIVLVIGGVAMAAPVQSGLGAFHWIISRGLYAIYGIALQDGLAYALISHTSQMLLVALLGTVSLIILLFSGESTRNLLGGDIREAAGVSSSDDRSDVSDPDDGADAPGGAGKCADGSDDSDGTGKCADGSDGRTGAGM